MISNVQDHQFDALHAVCYVSPVTQLTLSVPDETSLALKITPQELGGALRLAAAAKLYEMGKLSTGSAAALAGLPKCVFLSKLADYGVATFRLTEAELREDLANA